MTNPLGRGPSSGAEPDELERSHVAPLVLRRDGRYAGAREAIHCTMACLLLCPAACCWPLMAYFIAYFIACFFAYLLLFACCYCCCHRGWIRLKGQQGYSLLLPLLLHLLLLLLVRYDVI